MNTYYKNTDTKIWMVLVPLLVGTGTLTYVHLTNKFLSVSHRKNAFLANNRTIKGLEISGLSLVDKIRKVQKELYYFSKSITLLDQEIHDIKNNITDKKNLTIINSLSSDYFDKLKRLENCETIFFHISKALFLNILGPTIYAVHSNDCKSFTTRAVISQNFIDLKCQEGPLYPYVDTQDNNTLGSKLVPSLQTGYLVLNKRASDNYVNQSKLVDVGFMHVVKNANLTAFGDFITGNSYISITRCSKLYRQSFKATSKPYDKVFSISQYWGNGYYHFTNEDLPRIIFALQFLQQNKDVKIHVSSQNRFVHGLLTELGINKTRIVSGDVQARTAYIPGGSACGVAPVIPVHILSMFLRSKSQQVQKRDTIVLIKRSAKRWFSNHTSILAMLKATAGKYHLTVKIFDDRQIPTIPNSRKLFDRAIMVVAPHGAGLSNIIFSQPGTCVVEGLCYEANKVNHCYKHLAQVLGHIYHGVVPKTQCMQMEPKDLAPSVDQCLGRTTKAERKGT